MRKLAVFDLDGTLLDSLADIAEAANRALRLSGYPPHPQEVYKLFVGNGVDKLISRCLPPQHRQDVAAHAAVKQLFGEYYAIHSQDRTKPYPGIIEMLQQLRSQKVAVAVLSNKPHDYTSQLCSDYFNGLYDLAWGQRPAVPVKPDPTALLDILTNFETEPAHCIYVGDTAVDMQTGRSAGVYTAGVLWGFRTKDELIESGADVIIDKVSQLSAIILDNSQPLPYTVNI